MQTEQSNDFKVEYGDCYGSLEKDKLTKVLKKIKGGKPTTASELCEGLRDMYGGKNWSVIMVPIITGQKTEYPDHVSIGGIGCSHFVLNERIWAIWAQRLEWKCVYNLLIFEVYINNFGLMNNSEK